MTNNELILIGAGTCFGSFAWGMLWHFHRVEKPSRTLVFTAFLAVFSAVLHLLAVDRRRILSPGVPLVFYGTSLSLFWWAVSVTRRKLAACGQGSHSSELIAAGPYRYIRHPFYTSYNLAWIAGFAATGWWPLAVTALVMAVIYERAAREEERALSARAMSGKYALYRLRVGKYFPRFRAR